MFAMIQYPFPEKLDISTFSLLTISIIPAVVRVCSFSSRNEEQNRKFNTNELFLESKLCLSVEGVLSTQHIDHKNIYNLTPKIDF